MSAEWIVRTDRADAAGAWGALVVDMRMGWRRTAPFDFYKTTTGRTCPDDNERERARAAAAIAVARSVSIGKLRHDIVHAKWGSTLQLLLTNQQRSDAYSV